MIRAALVLWGFFVVLHVAGLRGEVAILSGTLPGSSLGAAAGLLYALAYFAAVLVAPVLFGTAVVLRAARVIARRRRGATRVPVPPPAC